MAEGSEAVASRDRMLNQEILRLTLKKDMFTLGLSFHLFRCICGYSVSRFSFLA